MQQAQNLTDAARRTAENTAKNNPLPNLAAATTPLYSGRKAPVSSDPHVPAAVADPHDVVQDTTKAAKRIYDTTLANAGDVVTDISNATKATIQPANIFTDGIKNTAHALKEASDTSVLWIAENKDSILETAQGIGEMVAGGGAVVLGGGIMLGSTVVCATGVGCFLTEPGVVGGAALATGGAGLFGKGAYDANNGLNGMHRVGNSGSGGPSAGAGGGTYPWSSPSVSKASQAIDDGETSITVGSRAEAEELLLGKFQGQGYRNAQGFDGKGTRQYFGAKKGTYHWDDELGEDGRVLRHGEGNADGDRPHLQIHTLEGPIIRIFWEVK